MLCVLLMRSHSLYRSRRWTILEENQPPKQIVQDGEYFIMKRVEGGGGHH